MQRRVEVALGSGSPHRYDRRTSSVLPPSVVSSSDHGAAHGILSATPRVHVRVPSSSRHHRRHGHHRQRRCRRGAGGGRRGAALGGAWLRPGRRRGRATVRAALVGVRARSPGRRLRRRARHAGARRQRREVTFAGAVAGTLHVTLAHGGGLRTSYSFLQSVAVRDGQDVARGDVVGTSGGANDDHARDGPAPRPAPRRPLRRPDAAVPPRRPHQARAARAHRPASSSSRGRRPTSAVSSKRRCTYRSRAAPQTCARSRERGRRRLRRRRPARGRCRQRGVRRRRVGRRPIGRGARRGPRRARRRHRRRERRARRAPRPARATRSRRCARSRRELAAELARTPIGMLALDLVEIGRRFVDTVTAECSDDAPDADGTGGSAHRVMVVAGINSSGPPATAAPPSSSTSGRSATGATRARCAGTPTRPTAARTTPPTRHGPLDASRHRLADQLRAMQREEPGREVDLIAHSQGGVVVDVFLARRLPRRRPDAPAARDRRHRVVAARRARRSPRRGTAAGSAAGGPSSTGPRIARVDPAARRRGGARALGALELMPRSVAAACPSTSTSPRSAPPRTWSCRPATSRSPAPRDRGGGEHRDAAPRDRAGPRRAPGGASRVRRTGAAVRRDRHRAARRRRAGGDQPHHARGRRCRRRRDLGRNAMRSRMLVFVLVAAAVLVVPTPVPARPATTPWSRPIWSSAARERAQGAERRRARRDRHDRWRPGARHRPARRHAMGDDARRCPGRVPGPHPRPRAGGWRGTGGRPGAPARRDPMAAADGRRGARRRPGHHSSGATGVAPCVRSPAVDGALRWEVHHEGELWSSPGVGVSAWIAGRGLARSRAHGPRPRSRDRCGALGTRGGLVHRRSRDGCRARLPGDRRRPVPRSGSGSTTSPEVRPAGRSGCRRRSRRVSCPRSMRTIS